MCGIVGMFSSRSCNDRNRFQCAQEMLSKLNHRGPDQHSIWMHNGNILGHTRLSIIGKDNGMQPIVDDDIAIVVNGEFYGYKKIRKRYTNYKFKTDSDSEILIPMYKERGELAFADLNGEFAFILYDIKKQRIFACRDRFGIKPLYYRESKDEYGNMAIEIASEPTAFSNLKLDESYVARVMSIHYPSPNESPYKGIKQVLPGHYLDINYYDNFSTCEQCRYAPPLYCVNNSIWPPSCQKHSYLPLLDAFRNYLYDAIETRLISDVPVCCHLSGGLDSSSVFGIAAKLRREPIPSFSIVFDKHVGVYNEEDTIRRTVAFHNAKKTHTFIHVSQKDILDAFDKAVVSSNGVAVNGHIACKWLLNKAIHEAGFKVALTGEGADECLCGYSHIKHDMFENASIDSMMIGTETPDGNMLDMSQLSDKYGFVPSFLKAKASLGYKLQNLMNADFVQRNKNRLNNIGYEFFLTSTDVFADGYDKNVDMSNAINKRKLTMNLWAKHALANYILRTLGDGCEMPHSVEGRLPFLDVELFKFCANAPNEFLYGKDMLEKMPLRLAAADVLTEEVRTRKKQPFQAPPITQFFSNDDWFRIYDCLTSEKFCSLGVFDRSKIEEMLGIVQSGDIVVQTAYEPVVMLLLSLNALKSTES